MPALQRRYESQAQVLCVVDVTTVQILTGHEKGVLSLSWCKQDADLLLSCGKDNRALCWNPQTSEIIGEVCSCRKVVIIADNCFSCLPRTIGHSKWTGALGTQIYSRPLSLTERLGCIQFSLPMSQAKPLHLCCGRMHQTCLTPQASRAPAMRRFRSNSLRNGFVVRSQARLGMVVNS